MASNQIPKLQSAAIVENSSDGVQFAVRTVPVPQPSPREALVRLSASGVCGTDMALASGKLGACRSILGHEGVGRVVMLGSDDTSDVRIGDRVGIAWVRDVCQRCTFCLSPDGETRCQEQMNSGRKIDGSFAEYALIPLRYVIPIPEGIEDKDVAPILCGGVTAYKALKVCGSTGGQWIAITGAGGGVGALAIQYAKVMGFRVIALDIGKKDFCLRLGADTYVDVVGETAVEKAVGLLTQGRMANAVLAVAGSGQAYQMALDLLAPFGTLVCVGIPPPGQLMQVHPLLFIDRGIRIIGSAVGSRADIREALEFVARGAVKPTVEVITLQDLPDVAKQFGRSTTKYVVKF